MSYRLGLVAVVGTVTLFIACSASKGSNFFDDNSSSTSATSGTAGHGGNGGGASSTSTGEGGFDPGTGGGGGSASSSGEPCYADDDEDQDQDGFTILDGDCNDCDPNVNPNAVEVILDSYGEGGAGGTMLPADEDCDDEIDEPPELCDTNLDVADMDPFNAARAVELCKMSTGPNDWGVVSAAWVNVDGTPNSLSEFHLGHGFLSAFGPNVNVQAGQRMLGLSSGTARQPTDPGYMPVSGYNKNYTTNHPYGFPKESPSCPGTVTGEPHDSTAVELVIKVPSNAHGFRFDFDFYTYEWPNYICSQYNDFFVALLDLDGTFASLGPFPQGQTDGNISFDQLGNPVSVNNAFLEVCGCALDGGPPCIEGGKTFTCSLGTAELIGTGFEFDGWDDHGATSWLATSAPVEPNATIAIRWGTYDSGDGVLDSTTLIDNWQWIAEPGTTVGTEPIPDPR